MKKRISLVLAVLCVGTLLFSGCGAKSKLEDGNTKLSAAKSLNYELSMDVTVSSGENQNTIGSVANMTYFPANGEFFGDMKYMTGGAEAGKVTLYGVNESDGYRIYTVQNQGDETMSGKQISEEGAPIVYNVANTFVEIAKNASGIAKDEQTTINGKSARKYIATIPKDKAYTVLNTMGVLGDMQALGASQEAISASIAANDLEVAFWLDESDGLPVRYSVDLKDALKEAFSKTEGAQSVSVDRCTFEMTILGKDTADKVTVPADVLENAVELTVPTETENPDEAKGE